MWPSRKSSYDSLPQTESSDSTVDGDSGVGRKASRLCSKAVSRTSILVLTNALTLLGLLAALYSTAHNPDPVACAKKLSTPSPALDIVKYQDSRHYDAAFRQTNRWRPAPGQHSDEVDLAWHEIELGAGGIRLTEEEVLALNITSTREKPLHKVPDEHGGGYLAMLEVFHLLHCLNTLRMGLWYNYENYKSLDEGVHEENVFTHYDHCIDMLRITLMCSADVTPAVFYDPLDNPKRRDALPDWSSLHTCRDFDAILDWNKHGPRAVRWRDAGANPAWDPNIAGADPPFEQESGGGHHH